MVNKSHFVDLSGVIELGECNTLFYIGIYLVFIFSLSVVSNSTLIGLFMKHKALRTPINGLIMTIIAVNLAATFFELPMIAYTAFSCKFDYGVFGCNLEAFLLYYAGCVDIYLLAVISFERFWVIRNPMSIRSMSFKISTLSMSICSLLSFFWSTMPMIGWSKYELEGTGYKL